MYACICVRCVSTCLYAYNVYVHAYVVGLLSCRSRRPARASHAALPQSQTYRKSPENAKSQMTKTCVSIYMYFQENIQPLRASGKSSQVP